MQKCYFKLLYKAANSLGVLLNDYMHLYVQLFIYRNVHSYRLRYY